MITAIDEHPVPWDRDTFKQELQERYQRLAGSDTDDSSPPGENLDDARRDDYIDVITDEGAWVAFRVLMPFGTTDKIYLWHWELEEGVAIHEMEGFFHGFKNLMATLVEEMGDCRDADYNTSLMPSGSHDQTCRNCGSSWSI